AAAWQAMQARAPQGVTARQQSLRQGLAGALQVSRVRSSSMWDATKANEAGNAISRALHSALTKEIAGVSAVEVLHSSVAQGIIRTLEWGPEYLANYHEARIRTGRDVLMNGGNPLEAFRQFTGAGTLGMLDLIDSDSAMRRN